MPLRLGMLGMWHTHAEGIVRQVIEHPNEFSLVAFHDPDAAVVAERRKLWEAKVPGFRLFDSAAKLLNEKLDGVIVEGRVHENLKLARLALESGKPVMLEKPAGTDLAEYRKLIELAQRKHLHLQMIYLFRYMPAVLELLRRAKAGEFGAVYEFRARLPKDLRDYRRFVDELKPYPGGIFFEMAGHVIDMMVAVLGKPANVTPFLAHHHTEPPKTYIDNGLAVFGFERAWGIIEVPALEVAPYSRRIELYGTQGAAAIPHLGSGHLKNRNVQPLDVYKQDGDWQRLELENKPLQLSDLREFAAVTAGKKAADYSLEHDAIVQEALLRASGMAAKP
jgi:predicted dehydrogenase